MDGSKTHNAPETLELLKSHGIEIVILPSHTSSVTQPLDVSFFRSTKQTLRTEYARWQGWFGLEDGESDPNIERIRILSSNFRVMMNALYDSHLITSGFRLSGIWPCQPQRLLTHPQVRNDDDQKNEISSKCINYTQTLFSNADGPPQNAEKPRPRCNYSSIIPPGYEPPKKRQKTAQTPPVPVPQPVSERFPPISPEAARTPPMQSPISVNPLLMSMALNLMFQPNLRR